MTKLKAPRESPTDSIKPGALPQQASHGGEGEGGEGEGGSALTARKRLLGAQPEL